MLKGLLRRKLGDSSLVPSFHAAGADRLHLFQSIILTKYKPRCKETGLELRQ
jgi:hypothetical protein